MFPSSNNAISINSKPNIFRLVLTKPVLINAIAVLSFFPFFAFIPGLEAETQPYCYLVTLLFFPLYKEKLPYGFFLFLLATLVYFGFYLTHDFLVEPDIKQLPYILIFIGPPLFFYAMYKHFALLNTKMLHWIFYIWSGVGLMQQFLPEFFTYTGLEKVFTYLMPRFLSTAFAEAGDRGVASLSNEPAQAGILFFAMFAVVIYRYLKGEISKRNFLFNCLLFIVSLVYNASLTMLIGALVLVIALIHQSRSYILSTAIVVAIIAPLLYFDADSRLVGIAKVLPDMLEANNNSLYDVITGPLGSNREFASYVGIKSAFYHFWGNGFYSSLTDFIRVAKEMDMDLQKISFFDHFGGGHYINMKPNGFGSLVLFEFGVIPFLFFNAVLVKLFLFNNKKGGPYKRLGAALAIVSLLFLNFYCVASLPSYWFALIVALNIMKLPKRSIEEGKEA